MKCNTCKNSKVNLYKTDNTFYCRNHYPGPDPAEFEAQKEHVEYVREKRRPRDNSIDFEEGNYLGLTEDDSLEAYHQQQANNEREMEELYRLRQNQLRKLNRSGAIERALNPSQYEIFRYIFEFNLPPTKIAKLKDCSHQYVYKVQKEVIERIKGLIY